VSDSAADGRGTASGVLVNGVSHGSKDERSESVGEAASEAAERGLLPSIQQKLASLFVQER
jgi:hypothetical protein